MYIIKTNGKSKYEANFNAAVTIWSDEANNMNRGRTDLIERVIIEGMTKENIVFTMKK